MFQKNEDHRQLRMFSAVDDLPETAKKKLEKSWANSFYHELFCSLDETIFADLYSKKVSRPNVPVNILFGFEAIKSGFGWSDEELYDRFLFDVQVRYALGLRDLDEGYFDLRTIYYFRRALIDYEQLHGVNLIQKAMEQITDVQLKKFKVKSGFQRMDSTLIQSNIRKMSRLQLLVELIIRLHRILDEDEKKTYEERFGSYVKQSSNQYCYRVKPQEAENRLQEIGKDCQWLVETFIHYSDTDEYKHLQRAFEEHFELEDEMITVKENTKLKGGIFQSPDDPEATYRSKKGEGAKGYVSNITETCDTDNELQLITRCSVEPNITDDQDLLVGDVENLKERMELNEVLSDGGYTGETASECVEIHEVDHHVSGIRGRPRAEGKLGLDDFDLISDAEEKVVGIKCPGGYEGSLREGRKAGRYVAGFESRQCESCPLIDRCPSQKLKKKDLRVLRFSHKEVRIAIQREQYKSDKESGYLNQRASIESTIRSVIHPFGGHLCKVAVRGKNRVTTMAVLSCAMVNIRRITGYLCPNGDADATLRAIA